MPVVNLRIKRAEIPIHQEFPPSHTMVHTIGLINLTSDTPHGVAVQQGD